MKPSERKKQVALLEEQDRQERRSSSSSKIVLPVARSLEKSDFGKSSVMRDVVQKESGVTLPEPGSIGDSTPVPGGVVGFQKVRLSSPSWQLHNFRSWCVQGWNFEFLCLLMNFVYDWV